MTTTDARKRNRDMADVHGTARARDAGHTTHFTVGNGWLANNLTGEFTRLDQESDMPNNQRRHREQMGVLDQIHDTLTEIRDRLPEREVACGDVWRDETERPCTRPSGHDGNHVDKVGTIWANPEPAPADVDPDEGQPLWRLRSRLRGATRYIEKLEADLARVTKECDEWEARHAALCAAGRALTAEWHARFMALPDATKRHADVLSDCTTQLDDILDRDDERAES